MAQEAAQEASPTPEKPAEGQAPEAPESTPGQEPQGEPKGEPKVFDAEYVKQLRKEAAGHRTEAQTAKAKLQEHEDAQKSELEKAQGKLTKAEQRAQEAESKLLRFEVASEKAVPPKLVALLTATSKEDLEAQADLILENAKPAQPAPDFDGGAREPAEAKTPAQAHNDLALALFGAPQNQQ